MTPDQLSKSGSEHGHQRAFFAMLKYCELQGYGEAFLWADYKCRFRIMTNDKTRSLLAYGVHAVPNGADYSGHGDKRKAQIEGGKMKAEGLKAGVWDIGVDIVSTMVNRRYPGMKIEFKRPELKDPENSHAGLTAEQIAYGLHCESQGYCLAVVYSWREAMDALLWYLSGVQL